MNYTHFPVHIAHPALLSLSLSLSLTRTAHSASQRAHSAPAQSVTPVTQHGFPRSMCPLAHSQRGLGELELEAGILALEDLVPLQRLLRVLRER